MMETNRAAWLPFKKAKPFEIADAPMPVPSADQIVIRVRYVAINPADAVVQSLGVVYETYPVVPGCDAAGEVVETGSDVQGLKKGDRVTCTVVSGAFQYYCPVTMPYAAKLPDSVEFKDAVVLPLAFVTSTVCMFEKDMLALQYPQLERPLPNGKLLFIWGGGSALGSCGIQMARAAGYEVATTCGRYNFDYCKNLGAMHVFDYRQEDVIENIVENLHGKESGGVFCPITAKGAVGQSARIAQALGGNQVVSVVFPPAVPIPDSIPEGVSIRQCELHIYISPLSRS